jgi:very-short-patch-repair endonuclease
VTRRALDPAEVELWQGLRHTTPLRTTFDLARTRPFEDAVVDVDRFLRRGLVVVGDARRAATTLTGRDCRHVRRVLEAADGLAESPQETLLRLLLRSAGLPAPVVRHVVRDADGRRVARVDFALPELRLALEYEGRWHGDAQQVGPDRQRLNRLSAAGWQVVFVTAEDLRRPAALLARLWSQLGPSWCA